MRPSDSLEGNMKRALGTLVGTGILLASTAAFAQQYGGTYSTGNYAPAVPSYPSGIDNIGNAGQFTIAVERITGLYFNRETTKAGDLPEQTTKTTHLALLGNGSSTPSDMPRAAFDYFVIDGLSLGGAVTYMSDAITDGPTQKLFLISPRVGYAYAFDDTFSVWPRAAFTYAHASQAQSVPNASGGTDQVTASINATQLTLEGMVGISPIKHVAFLAGPYVDLGLGGSVSVDVPNYPDTKDKLTSFGLTAAILAYF